MLFAASPAEYFRNSYSCITNSDILIKIVTMVTVVKGNCPSSYAWQNKLYLYIVIFYIYVYLHIACNILCWRRKNKSREQEEKTGRNSKEVLNVRIFCFVYRCKSLGLDGITRYDDCEWWTGKDLEGIGRQLIQGLFWYLLNATEKNCWEYEWGQLMCWTQLQWGEPRCWTHLQWGPRC